MLRPFQPLNPFRPRVIAGGGGGASAQILTAFTLPNVRNNYTGVVGMRFRVTTPVTVVALSRWCLAANAQNHTLRLHQVSGSVLLASVVVDAAPPTTDQWVDGVISPINLTTEVEYWLTSSEISGGDQWRDFAPIGNYTFRSEIGAATIVGVFGPGNIPTGTATGGPYVPVGFRISI